METNKLFSTLTQSIIIHIFIVYSVLANGFIVIPIIRPPVPVPPQQSVRYGFALEVKSHSVSTDISGMIATTSINQEFYNPTAHRLEGYYLFPVPPHAVINKFSMFINGKETEAELLDAKKARTLYEEIVRKMVDPALLEYYQQGLFKARIFPIEPYGTKRITISYSQTLTKNNGTIEYLYPLNTTKFFVKPLNSVSISVTVQSTQPLKNIYCTSHEAEIIRTDPYNAAIGYEAKQSKPDKDFALFFTTDSSAIAPSLLTYQSGSDDGYFFLNIAPSMNISEQKIESKNIVFVLDVSGSMAGEKIQQAQKALKFCIENLNTNDHFDIISFSTEARALFSKLVPFNKQSKETAYRFIEKLKAIGGTNIDEALSMALSEQSTPHNRPKIILFITDGKPTVGEIDEENLCALVKSKIHNSVRIFTLGIGDDLNTHLLDKITEITKAYRTYISATEDMEIKISDLYTKIQSPVFTSLKLTSEGAVSILQTYPHDLPDLFKGSSMTILGRYNGWGSSVLKLEGIVNGKKKIIEYPCSFVKNNSGNKFIPPLWAARRVGYLLDQIRLNGESPKIIDEIVQLARQHGIITPYTSYLIIEDEQHHRIDNDYRIFTPQARSTPLYQKSSQSYGYLKKKEGRGSVHASTEIQDLKQAVAFDNIQSSQHASSVSDNQLQSFVMVQGRAFYKNGKIWIDSYLQQKKKNSPRKRIQFASAEYFDLLQQYPDIAQFLALGSNVRFVYHDMIYDIYE